MAVSCGVGDGRGVLVGGRVGVATGVSVACGVTMITCAVGAITGANGSQAQISRKVSRMRSCLVINRNYSPARAFATWKSELKVES